MHAFPHLLPLATWIWSPLRSVVKSQSLDNRVLHVVNIYFQSTPKGGSGGISVIVSRKFK